MSDDSFIREVDEELRQDRAKALWDRFGPVLIGAAILLVLATAAFRGWQYWTSKQANASGDRYLAAIELAGEGKVDEAMTTLDGLQADGYGSYPVLARMRAATLLAEKGDRPGAVQAFDAVAADGSVPVSLRDMARLRAAIILVDDGAYEDVAQRVEVLASDTNPLRHSARELLGFSAWKSDRQADALGLFEQLVNDRSVPSGIAARAQTMIDLIRGSGAVPAQQG